MRRIKGTQVFTKNKISHYKIDMGPSWVTVATRAIINAYPYSQIERSDFYDKTQHS